jgi:hypothetical protein
VYAAVVIVVVVLVRGSKPARAALRYTLSSSSAPSFSQPSSRHYRNRIMMTIMMISTANKQTIKQTTI